MPSAQAQKEVILNEALSRIDTLMHLAVEEERGDPPANPAEGQCWLVGSSASEAWENRSGSIACFNAGDWLFIAPVPGLRCWNASTGAGLFYTDSWRAAAPVPSPSGGNTVDSEARQAIDLIIAELVAGGILAA